MQKLELIDKIAKRSGLTKGQASEALAAFIAETVAALKAGDKVTLIGFGTLKPTIHAPRPINDTESGVLLRFEGRRTTKFLPGKALKYLDEEFTPSKTKANSTEPDFKIL